MKPQETFLIRPAPGRRVKDPTTYKVLADEGETKPKSTYWLRRLHDGDVEEVQAAAKVHKQKTAVKFEPTPKEG